MGKMNVPRIVLGGVVAGILCFIGDGMIHGVLLKERWMQLESALGRTGSPDATSMAEWVLYDLAKGLVGVWLYAAIRPRFGAGPRTGAIAAVVTWLLVLPIAMLGFLPGTSLGRRFLAIWSIDGLVVMLIAIGVGAWLYREEGSAAAPARA
jgi:hypothetical protein